VYRLPCRRFDGALNVSVEELDPCDVAMVPHPEIGKAERPQRGLSALDLAKFHRVHRLKVRDPGGKAWRGRLIGTGQLEGVCDPANGRFI
jgi:hypothetical protein